MDPKKNVPKSFPSSFVTAAGAGGSSSSRAPLPSAMEEQSSDHDSNSTSPNSPTTTRTELVNLDQYQFGTLSKTNNPSKMPEMTPNVSFAHIAREWRMKWSMDDNKSSLVQIQSLVDSHLARIKKIKGVVNVQRIVCGACLDYKLIVTLHADDFDGWKQSSFDPEQEFLDKCRDIAGVHMVETQTYTIETL